MATLSPEATAELRSLLNDQYGIDQFSTPLTDDDVAFIGQFLLTVFITAGERRMEEAAANRQSVEIASLSPDDSLSYAHDMAAQLKATRIARGLTQMELATLIGHKSNNRISRWEKGLAKPDLKNALKLEKVLKIEVKTLFR